MGTKGATRTRKDFVGLRFGRLLVVGEDEPRMNTYGSPIRFMICKCDCGTTKSVSALRLNSGKTRSCGCLHRDICKAMMTTHGKRNSSAFNVWASMRQRCYNPNATKYPIYGGRGITVCARWRDSFASFYADMGDKPEGMSIDRIDPNGNYEPSNCRWASPAQQSNNLRTVRKFALNGTEYTMSELCALLGCTRPAIKMRLRRGQSIEHIVSALARR